MAERIIIRQNSSFETKLLASDPHKPGSEAMLPVESIRSLTPYGNLLASLGSCTAILLHAYARNREMSLREVEIRLQYERNFKRDCERCEEEERYEEHIDMQIALGGELTSREREKLFAVSGQCPIHKILRGGIAVQSRLAEEP